MDEKELSEALGPRQYRNVECKYCKKEIINKKGNKAYCNRKCSSNAYRKLNDESIDTLSKRRKRFKISGVEYRDLMESQKAQCAICKKLSVDCSKAVLHIDHDHKTNKLRGLLCYNCNIGLGNFQDDPELLESAITYLNKHK